MASETTRHGNSVTAKNQSKNRDGGNQRRHVEVTRSQLYEGPIPPPEILANFDSIEAGTAKRLIDQFVEESSHRRHLELITANANIGAQKANSELIAYKARAIVFSDFMGQVLSTVVCSMCIGGAVYLAMLGHYWVAGLLAAIPTATLVKSFFASDKGKD